jgi:predicted metal-dependent phosphoesterase TrpH
VVLSAPALCNPASVQDTASLRLVFASIDADSCPRTYNFHMHTNHSDGQLRPDILMDQALEIGLKGFAITDHHQTSGFYAALAYLTYWAAQPKNADRPVPQLWTGMEITSQLLEVEVHILGYSFDPQHPAIAPYITGTAPQGEMAQADRVIAAFHQAGGLTVLAHPARYRKSKHELIPAAAELGIDGVESYYAYNNPKPWQPSMQETVEVLAMTAEHNLLNTCGTDTHGLNLMQRV